jgi:hypothetical protein
MVMAAPDGRILKTRTGFQNADELFGMMQESLAMLPASEGAQMQEKLAAAEKLERAGEYVRSSFLYRELLEDGKQRPVTRPAQEGLRRIEKLGQDKFAQVKELNSRGKKTEAMEGCADIVRSFAGLAVSREAQTLMVEISRTTTLEVATTPRDRRATELLIQAEEFYKSKDYIPCLDRCEVILANFGDLPAGQKAYHLASEIKNNPDWLQNAADVMTDRLGGLYLALADSYLKRGEPSRAQYYLQRVLTAFPGSRLAESAQIRLNQLQGTVPVAGSRNEIPGPR